MGGFLLRYRPFAALYGRQGSVTLTTRTTRIAGAYGLYYLDDRPFLLRAGALPYWRLPPASWAQRIRSLRDSGCNAVAADVPWGWHAPSPGRVDLSGETDPRRDLLGCLRQAQDAGMIVFLCPGPSAPTQPGWLPDLAPEALARGPDGRPPRSAGGPTFSLLHPDYLKEVGAWYAALGAAVEPFAGAPVVAWHLGGESAGRPFAARLGALDFNPDTVDRYRRYLAARYESRAHLSREWRREVPDAGAVVPPPARCSPGELGDWQAFLETWVADYLERLADLARGAGVRLPLAAGAAVPSVSPDSPPLAASRVDFYGYALRPEAGPFGASQGALRFEPYAADERPLSAWGLTGVLQLGGAVAHGVKGYSTPPEAAAEAADEASARLQRWLAGAEEELTASVEVRDAIAYLDYPPYARPSPEDRRLLERASADPGGPRMGLLALLLTCGYNPAVLDLEGVTEAELADFPAAVFPAGGYLRLDDYGKLVVFTLRGGALLTFPEPPTRETDGTPINTRFLWPHRTGTPSLGGGLGGGLGRLLPAAMRPALRDARSGETLPAGGTVRTFPEAGRPFVRYGRAGVGAVPRAATEAVSAQVLLTSGGAPAGYRVQVRSGTSTVIGAPLAATYATPRYAALAPGSRLALRRFTVRLFEEVVPRQVVPEEGLEVEAVARLSPDGGSLLFVLNRLGAQTGWIRFPVPGALNLGDGFRAEVHFSATGSRAAGGPEGVQLDLAPGDCLVLRLI
jgi:hypothetical protein